MSTTTEFTIDTTIYTYVSDFAGETLVDGWLGPVSASEYIGQSVEQIAQGIADGILTLGAYYATRDQAEADRDDYPSRYRIVDFTTRELAELIMEMAEEQDADA